MKKAVAYLRVSKKEEDMENQRIAILEFAEKRDYRVIEWFGDEGVSGWKVPVRKRKRFKELLRYAEKHSIKTILFFDVSRFGRSWKDTVSTYFELDDEGYELIFTLQPYLSLSAFLEMFNDEENPEWSKFMAETTFYRVFIEAAIAANYEPVITSVRTKKGLQKARARGVQLGRPSLPAPVKELIITLYKKGYTYEMIRQRIREKGIYLDKKGRPRAPSLSTISNIIADYEQNRKNRGKLAR